MVVVVDEVFRKACCTCRETKPETSFSRATRTSDGLQSRCKDCNRDSARVWAKTNADVVLAWREAHPETVEEMQHRSHLKKHGTTLEWYWEQYRQQEGRCAICETDSPGRNQIHFHVDHDHACCPGSYSCGNCIRGLLCNTCNLGLGLFKDNPESFRNAIAYLQRQLACQA